MKAQRHSTRLEYWIVSVSQNNPCFANRGTVRKAILASRHVAPATERRSRCTSRWRSVVVQSKSATVLRAYRLKTAARHTPVARQGRRRLAKRAATPPRRRNHRGTRSSAATGRRAERLAKEIDRRKRTCCLEISQQTSTSLIQSCFVKHSSS